MAPMMSVWTKAYATSDSVQVAYQSVGSGAGIAQLQAGTVDFGDLDAFMSDSDIAKAKGPVVQIPLVQAPVVVVYNLPGIPSGLKFDGHTIGKIFAGTITMWNDPAITALNPGMSLPSTPIAVAHRSDGSGTTAIFTDFLTQTSPAWVTALGGQTSSVGKTVAWPVGIGGKGNDGVFGGREPDGRRHRVCRARLRDRAAPDRTRTSRTAQASSSSPASRLLPTRRSASPAIRPTCRSTSSTSQRIRGISDHRVDLGACLSEPDETGNGSGARQLLLAGC